MMCRLLGVSPSGFYAWRGRKPSKRDAENGALLARIRAVHDESRGTYGALRVQRELAHQGLRFGKNRIARLMRQASIRGVCRRKWVRTTRRDESETPRADLVERDFSATSPNRLWVADITYVPTWSGFLFLAVVLDAYSRRIVGWSMKSHLRTELVLDALEMALEMRKPDNVIHHSDRGCQYTSFAFGKRCSQAGVRPSVGSVGDAYDNAMCESFFATLECELLQRTSFRNHNEAALAVFEYIEGFYNPRRRHSALDYHSPMNYEQKAAFAASL